MNYKRINLFILHVKDKLCHVFKLLERTKKMPERNSDIIVKLAKDCCEKWFGDPAEGLIDISIYPAIGISIDQLREFIKIELPQQSAAWEGFFGAVDLENMEILDSSSHVQFNRVSGISLPSMVIRKLNVEGPAIIIALPIKGSKNINSISVIIPLLRLYLGSAIAWGYPYRLRYSGKNENQYTELSLGKPYSPVTEGPFKDSLNEKHIADTMDSSNRRVVLALEILTSANESTNSSLRIKVFQYWAAIEVLCETDKTDELFKHLFDGKLDKKSPEYAFFKKARTLRHNVIHYGHYPQSDMHFLERYLQVVFLDAMHFILKLTYEGYVEKFKCHHGDNWFQENYKPN